MLPAAGIGQDAAKPSARASRQQSPRSRRPCRRRLARTSRPTKTSASSATAIPICGTPRHKRLYIARDELADRRPLEQGRQLQRLPRRRLQDHRGQRSPRQGERLSRRGRGGAKDVRRLPREPGAGPGQERPRQGRARRTNKAAARCWDAASVTARTSTTSCRSPTAGRRCSSTTRCRPAASATRSEMATYDQTVHGHGLYQVGVAGDRRLRQLPRRPRHLSCGRPAVHALSGQRGRHLRQVPSLHRRTAADERPRPGHRAGRTWPKRLAPGGESRQRPSCTSCHQGHEIALAASSRFRQQLPNLCGNCHADLSSRYAMSIHGELTELGYQPAANCYDCHGAHSIQAVADPASRVSAENRLTTCRQCHPHATAQFRRLRSARQLPRSPGQPGRLLGLPGAVDACC